MKKLNRRSMLTALLTIVLIAGVVLPSGVFADSALPKSPVLVLPNDEFVFIETNVRKISLVEEDPLKCINVPMYIFNQSKGVLTANTSIDNYSSNTKVIVGEGISTGTSEVDVSSKLKAYDNTYYGDIFSIDQYGTAHYYFNGAWRTIKAGQVWTETIEKFLDAGSEKLTFIYTIRNHGILKKSNLIMNTPVYTPTPEATLQNTPTVSPDVYSVSGYISTDFSSTSENINSGFKVEIMENGKYTTTDENGFFKISSISPGISPYTLKISKENYLTRTIQGLNFDRNLEVGTKSFPIDLWAGDLAADGAVNMKDIMLAARLFNSTSRETRFDTAADINKDNVINMKDIMIIAKHFNTTTQSYTYRIASWQNKINLAINQKAEIVLQEGGIAGISWRYTIDNGNITFDSEKLEEETYFDQILDHKWVFKAVAKGETIIEFKKYVSGMPSGEAIKLSVSVTEGIAPTAPIPTPTPVSTQKPGSGAINSDSLKQTIITAHTGEKITSGKNMIFCPTFQMAWDGLKNLLKGDIVLNNQPPLADILNKGFPYSNSISEESYLAMSGFGPETVDKINNALKEKFKDNAPIVNETIGQSDAISYAFLFKNLKFAKAFETFKDPLNFESGGQSYNVKAFGINKSSPKYEDLSKQVEVYDYKSDDNFIVKLIPDGGQDEIILAKVVPGETLNDTYKSVMSRINRSYPGGFTTEDTLKIPVVDFDILHYYKELEGKMFEKPSSIGVMAKACQGIRFRLDENGAVLASEAKIIAMEPMPRNLVFDAPFLVCLKQKDAENPYLLIWVDNPEILPESK